MDRTFIDRLKVEQIELEEKLDKLGDFMRSPGFGQIHAAERRLLERQQKAMGVYSACLGVRLGWHVNAGGEL